MPRGLILLEHELIIINGILLSLLFLNEDLLPLELNKAKYAFKSTIRLLLVISSTQSITTNITMQT